MLKSSKGPVKPRSNLARVCWWELSSRKSSDSADSWARCENGRVFVEKDLRLGTVAALVLLLRGDGPGRVRWRPVRDALLDVMERALSPYFGSMACIDDAGVSCSNCHGRCFARRWGG